MGMTIVVGGYCDGSR